MSEPHGALFFWNEEPFVTGYLIIGERSYELVGIKRSDIRTDLKARKIEPEEQLDMFDDDGSGQGDSKLNQP